MKKNIIPIILNLAFIILVVASFFLQYEYLFLTRIASLIFAIVYLAIEVKKVYFSSNKTLFILIGAVSILAITGSILFDETSATNTINARSFMIPVFVFILLVIMYKDLYDKNNTTK